MKTLAEAQAYVGTDETSGAAQLEILRREGLQPHMNVLEIGCGCLSAGVPLMQALNIDCYVGIEPNKWLVDAAMQVPRIKKIVEESKAVFIENGEFDASGVNRTFDFILSHSVLSHCGKPQLYQFLQNANAVLAPNGKIVASLRLVQSNDYGHSGSPDKQESKFKEWQYPGVAYYHQSTVADIAYELGLICLLEPNHTKYMTSIVPKDFHDWMVFARPD